jgi:hypothetical protein
MVPLVQAALINAAANKMSQPKQVTTGRSSADVQYEIYRTEQKRKRRRNTMYVIGGIAALYFGTKQVKKLIRNQTDKSDTIEVQLAKRLNIAMHPTGIRWLPDGTQESEVFTVAEEIAGRGIEYSEVQKAYQKIFGISLSEEFQSELDSKEYTKLLKIVSPEYALEKQRAKVYAGKIVITIKDAKLYKKSNSPVSFASIELNSVFSNAVTTGNIEFGINKTRFEIKALDSGKTIWMDSGDVGTISNIANIKIPLPDDSKSFLIGKGYKLYKI